VNEYTAQIVRYRLNKGQEAILEAEVLLETRHWNTSINRSYYACFYAVSSLLLLKDVKPKTHTGTRTMFHQHLIQGGILTDVEADVYDMLFDSRQEGDYIDFVEFDTSQAYSMLQAATAFVRKISKLITDELQRQDL
jgi:uncharacterized protein (UPF0332 family)